ncbi:MAG: hypothetical protein KatS3mg033_1290 [Thermonema sp.]|uniref:hypothetical protein n=1 Tax=Thermonema sp. TaxID=2231181 RepID=UPI0021DE2354|nr:hypothetical protein [Thermonema sp.]GIV39490.1 MAG: hypothetical protein KatS3mg033_1290 [Thermonema sp.]
MKTFSKLLLLCLLCVFAQHAHAQDNAPLYMLLEDIPGQPAKLYKSSTRPMPLNEPGPFGDSLEMHYLFSFQITRYLDKNLTSTTIVFITAFDARLRGKKPNMHREIPLSEVDNLPVMSPAELAQLILSDYNGDKLVQIQDHLCSFFFKCQRNKRPLFVVEKLQDKAVIYRVEFVPLFCEKE